MYNNNYNNYNQYDSDKSLYHHQYKHELDQYPSSHLFYQFIDILHAHHFHTEAEKLLTVAHHPNNMENHQIITQVIKEMRDSYSH